MSISKRKLMANRANAQKSTGATSQEGKQKVSWNAVQHGLCGRFRVLASENQDEYDRLLEKLIEAEQPADHTERELVAKMARHTWMSERSMRFQDACFVHQPQTPEQQANERQTVAVLKDLDIYLRYQVHHDRAYQRAASELARRRKDRALAARGFESQKRAAAAEARAAEAAERSWKQQNQRDEWHSCRVASAKLHLEQQFERSSKAKAAGQAPDTGQIAA